MASPQGGSPAACRPVLLSSCTPGPFGRPYGLVVTPTQSVTISAGIDAGQPWRRCHGDNITYTDWQRDNYWRAILSVTGEGRVIGCEADHLTLLQSEKLNHFLKPKRGVDIAPALG